MDRRESRGSAINTAVQAALIHGRLARTENLASQNTVIECATLEGNCRGTRRGLLKEDDPIETYRIVFKFVGPGDTELRYVGHHYFIYDYDLFR